MRVEIDVAAVDGPAVARLGAAPHAQLHLKALVGPQRDLRFVGTPAARGAAGAAEAGAGAADAGGVAWQVPGPRATLPRLAARPLRERHQRFKPPHLLLECRHALLDGADAGLARGVGGILRRQLALDLAHLREPQHAADAASGRSRIPPAAAR